MRWIRRREVIIQAKETLVLRPGGEAASCPHCGTTVSLLAPDAAAVLFRVPSRWIYRWLETGELHFLETKAGSVLVCPDSLRLAIALHAGDLSSAHKLQP